VYKDFDQLSETQFEEIDQYLHESRFEIVCCCIDDHVLSTKIYYQCKVLGLNANIADKPKLCDFYFGSMINKDNLQIMVSTNGKSPRLLKLIKDNIKRNLDGDISRAIENLNLVRFTLRDLVLKEDDVNTIELRMTWIKTLTDFFSIKQWGEFDINEGNVKKVVGYYPEFPPKDLEEFKEMLRD
jgi:precorrin-2 dehydrogenase/sirohydrochlorin ferrochelatase